MSISGIGSTASSQSAIAALLQQRRTEAQSLASSIQSGSVTSAQTALTSFQQDLASIGATTGVASTPSTSTSQAGTAQQQSPFQSDFASLVSAVQVGNMSAAQTALTSLESDLQSSGSGYGGGSTYGSSAPSAAVSDLQSLLQAVQSGNLPAAQTALATLQSDGQAQVQAQEAGQTRAASGHHHHHHHGGGGGVSSSSASSTSSANTASSVISTSPTDLTEL